jgi:hypothetical protein
MGVFFNGRLYISPATASLVDDSGMANKNLSVGNVLALIGKSLGGKPNTALRFGSAAEARAVLLDGELLRAIEKAFDPSSQTTGPSTIVAIRVNPATQAVLALKDAVASTVINLLSTDYGIYTNQIKVKIESGSVSGKKITTQIGNNYFSQDNVSRRALDIVYTGAEVTATATITNSTLTLAAPAGTVVSTIDLAAFDTVQKVVDRINSVAGFASTVLDNSGEKPSLNALDSITAQSVKTTAYAVTADLQALIDWINGASEGYITATRAVGAGTMPVNLPFTYLAGAVDGTVTNTEWSNAFTVLQSEDVQWVVPVSPTASIHAMADSHVAFMSNVARMERRAIAGGASGATDAEAIAAAKNLNSDRTSYTHLGFYDYDTTGKLALFEPYIMAALLAGMFAGVNPATALTNKSIKVRGLERKLRNPTDTDQLILGGVLCVEDTPTGYKVVKSISTWLNNTNYNRVEVSVGVGYDFVSRNVRNALDPLRGSKGSPATLKEYVSRVDSALRALALPEPMGPGVLVGDKTSPAYKNITASLEGDVVRVEFECSVGIPTNYILCVVHAVPYSGSAKA